MSGSTPVLQLRPNTMQESSSQFWPVSCSDTACLSVRLSACLWPCPSVCLLLHYLSLQAGCPLFCLVVYLQYQTVDPVCVWQMMFYFVCVCEWCHSGVVCQGRKPRCLFVLHRTPSRLSGDESHTYRNAHVHMRCKDKDVYCCAVRAVLQRALWHCCGQIVRWFK